MEKYSDIRPDCSKFAIMSQKSDIAGQGFARLLRNLGFICR